MKTIIAKITISIVIFLSIVFATHKILYSNNVYVITYDTYVFIPENQGLKLNTKDDTFTVRANSEYEAKEKTLDMIYLNYLCIADKVVIKKIVEL